MRLLIRGCVRKKACYAALRGCFQGRDVVAYSSAQQHSQDFDSLILLTHERIVLYSLVYQNSSNTLDLSNQLPQRSHILPLSLAKSNASTKMIRILLINLPAVMIPIKRPIVERK